MIVVVAGVVRSWSAPVRSCAREWRRHSTSFARANTAPSWPSRSRRPEIRYPWLSAPAGRRCQALRFASSAANWQAPVDIVDVERRNLHVEISRFAPEVSCRHYGSLSSSAQSDSPVRPLAQTPTADQRGACKADYEKFLCAGTAPGGGRIIGCLNKQYDQLSDTCKKALDSRKK